MKNNKLLYLLTIFITLFTFNINANAARGLTCVYKAGWTDESRKSVLIQNPSGTRTVYVNNNKDAKFESLGWGLKQGFIDISKVDSAKKDNEGNLLECPGFVETMNDGVSFADSDKWYDTSTLFYEENIPSESSKDFKIIEPSIVPPTNKNGAEGWLIDTSSTSYKYTGACKYKRMLDNGEYHYIEMYYGKENIMFTEYNPLKTIPNGLNFSGYSSVKYKYDKKTYSFALSIDKSFTPTSLFDKYGGDCPPAIIIETPFLGYQKYNVESNIKLSGDGLTYYIESDPEKGVIGKNPLTGNDLALDDTLNIQIDFIKPVINSCEDLLGRENASYLNIIWNLVKIGIPIILIVFGGIDFVQAIFAGKEDNMKKAQEKFIKRIIIAIVIFIIPTLLSFLLGIVNSIWGNIGNDLCGIIF